MDTLDNEAQKTDSLDIEALKKERDDYLNGWRRAQADLINFKKEMQEKISDVLKFSAESMIKDFLIIMGDFDRAIKNGVDEDGIKSIKDKIEKSLEKQGVKKINSVLEKFDPRFHEAVSEIEDPQKESQTIVEEIQPGFMLYEKVILPAKVVIIK